MQIMPLFGAGKIAYDREVTQRWDAHVVTERLSVKRRLEPTMPDGFLLQVHEHSQDTRTGRIERYHNADIMTPDGSVVDAPDYVKKDKETWSVYMNRLVGYARALDEVWEDKPASS